MFRGLFRGQYKAVISGFLLPVERFLKIGSPGIFFDFVYEYTRFIPFLIYLFLSTPWGHILIINLTINKEYKVLSGSFNSLQGSDWNVQTKSTKMKVNFFIENFSTKRRNKFFSLFSMPAELVWVRTSTWRKWKPDKGRQVLLSPTFFFSLSLVKFQASPGTNRKFPQVSDTKSTYNPKMEMSVAFFLVRRGGSLLFHTSTSFQIIFFQSFHPSLSALLL